MSPAARDTAQGARRSVERQLSLGGKQAEHADEGWKGRVRERYHQQTWEEPLIYDLGSPGERGILPPGHRLDRQGRGGRPVALVPPGMLCTDPPALPQVAQPQIMKHYTWLSQELLAEDSAILPSQGTCSMKYSSKVNERLVNMDSTLNCIPGRMRTRSKASWRCCTSSVSVRRPYQAWMAYHCNRHRDRKACSRTHGLFASTTRTPGTDRPEDEVSLRSSLPVTPSYPAHGRVQRDHRLSRRYRVRQYRQVLKAASTCSLPRYRSAALTIPASCIRSTDL